MRGRVLEIVNDWQIFYVISNPVVSSGVKSSQQRCPLSFAEGSTITDGATGGIDLIHLRLSVLICLYLRLKKEKVLTADDNGLTPMHAEVENRVRGRVLEIVNY